VNQTEQKKRGANPFTTALVIGLGWGLVFGFWNGLPTLLELPILPYLWVRLLALTYLVVWCGLTGAIVLGLFGAVAWGLMRFLRREVKRRTLVAIYSGIFIDLVILASGIPRLSLTSLFTAPSHAAIALLLLGLGSAVGLAIALGIYSGAVWWQSGRGFLRPLRWKPVQMSVVIVFLGGVISLTAAGVYRNYLRDLAIFQPQPSGQAATPEQPNVLLITIDALRADHLGIYGYDPEISPNIDALARRGVVFEQAISQAPWTAPSVASFITSLYPTELGITPGRGAVIPANVHLDGMRVTLAETFQDAGYRTHAYAGNLFISHENGYNQGFEHLTYARSPLSFDVDALVEERILPWTLCRGPVRAYTQLACNFFFQGHLRLFDPRLDWDRDPLVTEYGLRFLRSHQDERFFLWLFYVGPHDPYNPPEPYRPFPDEITPKVERLLRGPLFPEIIAKDVLRPVDLQALVSLYDGEIAYTDELVGQVLDELDELGLTDNTIVVLLADHGEEFADHGGYGHSHTLYDELLHVPFIVSGPGVGATGRRVETQVRLLDMLPTVCDLTGLPVPEEAVGRSLVPFLEGQEMDELPAFSESVGHTVFEKKSIRHNGYKLIYDVEREIVELYDLQADLHELTDLNEQESEVVEAMVDSLQTWMAWRLQVTTDLPRERPLAQELDDAMRQRLRDAGY
jgi:arylsulfatase A-like enzyme